MEVMFLHNCPQALFQLFENMAAFTVLTFQEVPAIFRLLLAGWAQNGAWVGVEFG